MLNVVLLMENEDFKSETKIKNSNLKAKEKYIRLTKIHITDHRKCIKYFQIL